MRILAFIEDEEVIEKILKHLGLWDLRVRPPPKVKAPPVRFQIDYSDSQISSFDSFYAGPDSPIDSYGSSRVRRVIYSIFQSIILNPHFPVRLKSEH